MATATKTRRRQKSVDYTPDKATLDRTVFELSDCYPTGIAIRLIAASPAEAKMFARGFNLALDDVDHSWNGRAVAGMDIFAQCYADYEAKQAEPEEGDV